MMPMLEAVIEETDCFIQVFIGWPEDEENPDAEEEQKFGFKLYVHRLRVKCVTHHFCSPASLSDKKARRTARAGESGTKLSSRR